MLLATGAGPAYYKGCAQQTFTVQNKPAAVAPKETITLYHFSFRNQQETGRWCAKICGGAENVVKKQNPANIRKMDCSVLLL